MIRLTFTVDNINTVIQVYNRIEVQRAVSENGTYTTVSGLGPVVLSGGVSTYVLDDATGISTDWYVSRYYSTNTGYSSEWSAPVLGESGVMFYNPLYPEEIDYGTSQKLVISRIRRLIGDPINLRRIYGEEAAALVHLDSKTIELSERGWPASVIMGGINFSSTNNPSVNDYKYLIFVDYIGDICEECVTYSGCGGDIEKVIPNGIDIWFYTFRNSDRQIMESYDACPPPFPLTIETATSEVYMLQTAIDILKGELWQDSTEDGAIVKDETTSYDPSKGQDIRKKLLDGLEARLDRLVKVVSLSSISGVLID